MAEAKTTGVVKELAAERKPRSPTMEIGSSGLMQFSGYVREEFLKQLMGPRGAKTYREMRDNDAIINAAFSSMETMLRQCKWHIDPENEEDAADLEAAEFLQENWDNIDPPNFVAEALEFLTYGWAWFEIIYKRDGGKLYWERFAGRAQESLERWEFAPNGDILGMWQRSPVDGKEVLIPIDKSIHIRTTQIKNNPEGRSVLRGAYRSYYHKKSIENIESIGIERDLAGIGMFTVPAHWTNPSDPNYTLYLEAQKMATRIRRDEQEGLVIPAIYDSNGNQIFKFELVASPGKRQFDTTNIITRYDSRIAMTLLADFLMLGHEKVGSFALAEGKIDLFSAGLGTWLDVLQAAVNLQAEKLYDLNGFSGRAWIRHGDIKPEDLTPLVKQLAELTKVGILFPDDGLEVWIREMIGAPARDGEREMPDEDDMTPEMPEAEADDSEEEGEAGEE